MLCSCRFMRRGSVFSFFFFFFFIPYYTYIAILLLLFCRRCERSVFSSERIFYAILRRSNNHLIVNISHERLLPFFVKRDSIRFVSFALTVHVNEKKKFNCEKRSCLCFQNEIETERLKRQSIFDAGVNKKKTHAKCLFLNLKC